MNDQLLPCPFCGSENLSGMFAGLALFVRCNDCGAYGPCSENFKQKMTREEAVANWNRRASKIVAWDVCEKDVHNPRGEKRHRVFFVEDYDEDELVELLDKARKHGLRFGFENIHVKPLVYGD